MNLNRPANLRTRLRWLVIVTLLCWATQTLIAQWGYGAELDYVPDGQSQFIAPDRPRIVMLELKEEATIHSATVHLRQVVRYRPSDARALDATLDLALLKIPQANKPFELDLETIKHTMEQNGVNLLTIQFCGATACRVTRSDEPMIGEHADAAPAPTTRPAGSAASSTVAPLAPSGGTSAPARTLRNALTEEVTQRFSLDPEAVQIRFRLSDEPMLKLSGPTYRFDIRPRRQGHLGDLTWDVIAVGAGTERKATITANVMLWRKQLMTRRAIAYKQVFHDDDIDERRVLVDRLPDGPALTREQVVGSEAAQAIGPGMVISGRMVQATQLVRTGQLITVTVRRHAIELKWVAEARESGVFGQVVRVRRPGTREEFQVRITGDERGELVGAGDGAGGVLAGR